MKQNVSRLEPSEYPEQLRTIHSLPKQLYILGHLPAADHWVAIVGSRRATVYGKDVARHLAYELARRGIVIVSGLALGIDAVAHQSALEAGGLTVAVLGGGFDQLYPATNRNLAAKIIETGGAILSEYEPAAPPLRQQFPARNRIIAGLAQVTIVAEAALDSGSLITATFAMEEGRDVMAVPGNINQPGSAGCNNLIKSGALPVTEVGDVLLALGISERDAESLRAPTDPFEQKVYSAIQAGTSGTDELIKKLETDMVRLSVALTSLEINNYIHPIGGGQWSVK
jgi:DNA processing protein